MHFNTPHKICLFFPQTGCTARRNLPDPHFTHLHHLQHTHTHFIQQWSLICQPTGFHSGVFWTLTGVPGCEIHTVGGEKVTEPHKYKNTRLAGIPDLTPTAPPHQRNLPGNQGTRSSRREGDRENSEVSSSHSDFTALALQHLLLCLVLPSPCGSILYFHRSLLSPR